MQLPYIVVKEYLDSDQQVEGMDWRQMAEYIAENSTKHEQIDWKVEKYIPSRACSSGTFPTIASMGGPKPASSKQWTFPWVKPGRLGENF